MVDPFEVAQMRLMLSIDGVWLLVIYGVRGVSVRG